MIKPEDYLGHWKLNGNLKDYSGRGNDLAQVGTSSWGKLPNGKVGYNIAYGNYGATSSNIQLTGDFTVYSRVKVDSNDARRTAIITSYPLPYNADGGSVFLSVYPYVSGVFRGLAELYIRYEDGTYTNLSQYDIFEKGEEVFIAGTYDRDKDTLTLVVNDFVRTTTLAKKVITNSTPYRVGYAVNTLTGEVVAGDVAILDKCLSVEQLQKIRRASQPTPKPKPLYFPEKPVITDGLIWAVGFKNPLKDQSTNNRDLTITLGTPAVKNIGVKGFGNGGFTLSGALDDVRSDKNWCMCAWCKVDGDTGDNQTFVTPGVSASEPATDFRPLINYYKASGYIGGGRYYNPGTGGYWEVRGTAAEYGRWYFIIYEHYSDATYKVYVNNVEVSSASYGYCVSNTTLLYSGTTSVTNEEYVNGEVKNVYVFNRHLTDAEKKLIFNTTIPDDTLVLDWQGRDMSRYANTQTYTSPVYVGTKTKFGGGKVSLSHIDEYDFTDKFTILFWAKPSDLTTNQYVLDKGASEYAIILGYQDGYWNFFPYKDAQTDAQIEATKDAWQMIVYTKDDDGTWRGYKNGELIFDRTNNFTLSTTATNLLIGCNTTTDCYSGEIADVKLYTEAKSAEWIANYYKSTRGLY